MDSSSITILASGNSLGAYIPAMYLHTYLQREGVETRVFVLENFFHKEVRDKIRTTKNAFHADFSVARMGHKLAKPVNSAFNEENVVKLLEEWKEAEVSSFAVFTGFWLPILDRYKAATELSLDIRLIRLDAWDTPSYKVHKNLDFCYKNEWFYDLLSMSPSNFITSDDTEPLPYEKRAGRILIHGGGWGIGNYAETISELRKVGYNLDVIVYDSDEVGEDDGMTRYFGIEPTWDPWRRDTLGQHTFPPMIRYVRENGILREYLLGNYSDYTELMRNCAAVISKPGGATLNDSISYGIPFVLLEPFGDHELHNSNYWEACGFGIRFSDWKFKGFSEHLLKEMSRHLLEQRSKIKHYGRATYAAKDSC